MLRIGVLMVLALGASAQYYGNYYCTGGKDVFVHLFEWKWNDVKAECSWLASNGYCAVQVSPVNEARIVYDPPYPWYQRYQPVSYKMGSRSGTEQEFISMVETCNNAGVFIYADAVINHMTGGGSGTGSDGSTWSGDNEKFPAVPYDVDFGDFHGSADCPTASMEIDNYGDAVQVRNCRLVGLRDLRGNSEHVQQMISEFMNKLIGWGVAGFRIDASKHMWPNDMMATFGRLNNLNTRWFPAGSRPYIFQEVIDMGGEGITVNDYKYIGRVTEFRYGKELGDVVRQNWGQRLAYLQNFGESWGMMNGLDSVAFIDNHDNQRGHGAGGFGTILTFFEANQYKIANAFQLAWPYGHTRIMSSYNWPRNIVNGKDTNDWIGPPSYSGGVTKNAVCFNGDWICEHRWRQIYNMVKFHNVVLGTTVQNWWDNAYQAIAFSRGNKGWIAINNEGHTVSEWFNTGLPAGEYCDVISCDNNRPPCSGSSGCHKVTVDSGGWAHVSVHNGEDPMVAIHV